MWPTWSQAAVAAFGVRAASASHGRWIGTAHLVLTTLVIVATGYHRWLDGLQPALIGARLT